MFHDFDDGSKGHLDGNESHIKKGCNQAALDGLMNYGPEGSLSSWSACSAYDFLNHYHYVTNAGGMWCLEGRLVDV